MASIDVPAELAQLRDSDEALVVVDREGVVVLMTPAAEKLWGFDEVDVVGEFVEMLVPNSLRWGHQAYRRGFIAEPSPREMADGMQPHLQRADESLVPIAVRLEPTTVRDHFFVVAHINVLDGH
jgi:PAS domain S-box-containing protein